MKGKIEDVPVGALLRAARGHIRDADLCERMDRLQYAIGYLQLAIAELARATKTLEERCNR